MTFIDLQDPHQTCILSSFVGHITDLKQGNTDITTGSKAFGISASSEPSQMGKMIYQYIKKLFLSTGSPQSIGKDM